MTNQLKWLALVLIASSIVACGTVDPQVVVKTEYVEKKIPLQAHPKGVNIHPVYFYAVNQENIDEFLSRFQKENGDVVFFAISVPHYENLSLNLADLKRYIGQQKSLIIYYEDSIVKQSDLPENTEEVIETGSFLGIEIK